MGYLKSFSKVRKKKKRKSVSKGTSSSQLVGLIGEIESQISGFSDALAIVQSKYSTEMVPPIFENFLFFRLVYRDILTLVNQLLNTKNERERNLTARSLAQHLYEFLDDCQDFLGKKMKGGLSGFESLPNYILLEKDLYKIKELLRAVKDKTFKSLGDIRHNVSAHKEQNSLLLQSKIANIKINEIHAHAVVCTILFVCIMQFQNNVFAAIVGEMGIEKREELLPQYSYKSPEQVFREFSMIVGGVDPMIANVFAELNNDELDLLKRVLEELQNRESNGKELNTLGNKTTSITSKIAKWFTRNR